MLSKLKLTLLILTLITLSSNTFALDESTLGSIRDDLVANLLKLEKDKVYQSVQDRPEVEENSCKTEFTTNEYEDKITQNIKDSSKVSQTTHGVSFKDESPELIELFKKLASNEREETKLLLNTKCSKVLCAVKEIFGTDEGPRILYILQEYGLNASNYSFINTSPWPLDELDLSLMALEDLPKGLLPFSDNKQFAKNIKGKTYKIYANKKGCVEANAQIRFFDCWSTLERSKYAQMGTVTHELAHYIAAELDLDKNSKWLSKSNWESFTYQMGNNLETDHSYDENKGCFLSTYGQTNPAEDFAETLVAYRYTPQVLKDNCLSKYNYIKDNVFQGIEFTRDKNFCQNRPAISR